MKTLPSLPLAFAFAMAGMANADDWTQFRGPGNASAADVAIPTDWSVETGANVAWEVDVPARGVSCPIVVDGKVIITASGGLDRTRLHVLAYDTQTGKRLWRRQFWSTGRTNCHNTSAMAAGTPTTDGKRIFALFASNDLVCLDLEGNLQWIRTLVKDHPGIGNDVGMASSPVMAGGLLVVQCECQVGSFAAGFDPATGDIVWQVDRPGAANWASPTPVTYANGKAGVVLQSGKDLTLLNAKTGDEVWGEAVPCSTITSTSSQDGVLIVPSAGLVAMDLTGEKPEVIWRSAKPNPSWPTPILHNGRMYVISGSAISCVDIASQDISWRKRLKGQFWATPLLSDGKLYCINTKGEAFVVQAEDGSILSKPKFGEDISASPAAADGGMYVRSHKKLWKIAVQHQARR